MAALLAATLAACGGDDGPGPTDQSGRLEGQVIIAGTEAGAGPLVGATVTISQIDENSPTGAVRTVAGTVTTDAGGRYGLDVGLLNGLFLVEAAGGSYVEPASGETIALDAAASIRTLHHLPLLAVRTDALVSPVGHLTHALAQALLDAGATGQPAADARLDDAHAVAADHLDRHFGDVAWEAVVPANPSVPAPSPTEPVRAAFVLAGWPILAADLASAASASVQEVNTFSLMNAWADDLAAGPFPGAFDGNDGNEQGGGLLLGACPPFADVTCDENLAMCPIGACRNACDLYAGTPRAYFGGAVSKFIRSTDNGTGLGDADTLPVARAIADNPDELLFGAACRDNLDRTPPTITFEAPTPAAGAVVRQTQTITARALDDTDGTPPRIALTGPTGPLPDADGIPDNEVASTTLDTATSADGSYTVTATATDISGNASTQGRTFTIDNTAPTLTVSQAGFFVRSVSGVEQWWSGLAAPVLTGTVDDANLADITIRVGAIVLGTATVTGSDWTFTIPAGQATHSGLPVDVSATDLAGNDVSLSRRIYADTTPPQLLATPSTVADETRDTINFGGEFPAHAHTTTGQSTLGQGGCPDVFKHVTLMSDLDNPIRFNVIAADESSGIGLDPTTVRVRPWIGTTAGAWRSISSPIINGNMSLPMSMVAVGSTTSTTQLIPELATTEGTFEMEFEARDFLGRLATARHCANVHPLAPPIEVYAARVPSASNAGHVHALMSAGLSGTSNRVLANGLLNDNAPGLSVMDYDFMNSNTRGLTLSVTLPGAPATRSVSMTYGRHNVRLSNTPVSEFCSGGICMSDPHLPMTGTAINNQQQVTIPNSNAPVTWGVRLFEIAAPSGALLTEVPCTTCGAGGAWSFAVSGRRSVPSLGPKRYFRVMTVIKALPALRPKDGILSNGQPDNMITLPLIDGPLNTLTGSLDITGVFEGMYSRCTSTSPLTPAGDRTCLTRSQYLNYRALKKITFEVTDINSQPSSTPSLGIAPRAVSSTRTVTFEIPDAPAPNPFLEGTLPISSN